MGSPTDRTWYNALVDDAGTGTTGTIWNKAQLNSEITAVDNALAPLITGPGSAVAGNIPSFGDTTGKLIADSGVKLGALTNIPFSAANFIAGGGTWTVTAGNVAIFQYVIAGHLCYITLYLTGSTITGTPSVLQILNLPFTPIATTHLPVWGLNSTWKVLDFSVSGGSTTASIYIDPSGTINFVAGSTSLFLSGVVAI
jgi:hypothetical protein